MKSSILIAAGITAAIAIAGCASTVKEARNLNPFTASTAFQHYDIDGNGVIGKPEADKYPPLKKNFNTIDTNRDAVIQPTEFSAAMTFLEIPPDFQRYDGNGDGVVTESEACNVQGDLCDDFDRVDADDDDNVSKAEFKAAQVNLLQGVSFNSIDTDGDGVISEQEAQANSAILWELFGDVDQNDDDQINKQEFKRFQNG